MSNACNSNCSAIRSAYHTLRLLPVIWISPLEDIADTTAERCPFGLLPIIFQLFYKLVNTLRHHVLETGKETVGICLLRQLVEVGAFTYQLTDDMDMFFVIRSRTVPFSMSERMTALWVCLLRLQSVPSHAIGRMTVGELSYVSFPF